VQTLNHVPLYSYVASFENTTEEKKIHKKLFRKFPQNDLFLRFLLFVVIIESNNNGFERLEGHKKTLIRSLVVVVVVFAFTLAVQ
jgi:hypothetical protein